METKNDKLCADFVIDIHNAPKYETAVSKLGVNKYITKDQEGMDDHIILLTCEISKQIIESK